MPVVYSIDSGKRLIRTTCTTPLILEDVINHFRALAVDPECSGHLDVFLDVSDADRLPQTDQFGLINGELGSLREKVQFQACAIVAARDAMFGMMRVFEVHAGPYFRSIRVFRKPDEAEAWLAQQSASRAEK